MNTEPHELVWPEATQWYVDELRGRHRGSYIFLRDVCAITQLPDTYIRSLIQRGAFPVPVRLDGRRQSFVLGEVLDWDAAAKVKLRSRDIRPDAAEAVKKGGLKRAENARAKQTADRA